MSLYKNKYRVETTRLQGWNYSQNGYYFITVCVQNREHLFGQVVNNEMILNKYGIILELSWFDLPNHYHNIQLDSFVVMPNHIHGIVIINNDGSMNRAIVETGFKPVSTSKTSPTSPTKSHGLFEFMRALKTFSARRINELRNSIGEPVWQSRFYDHIIRDNQSFQRIRDYIENNPKMWNDDMFNKYNAHQ